jgi:hypothetical protein
VVRLLGARRNLWDIRALTFRQRDVTAAIKSVERAGHAVARVEIGPDGRIVVILAPQENDGEAPVNEWDQDPASPPLGLKPESAVPQQTHPRRKRARSRGRISTGN